MNTRGLLSWFLKMLGNALLATGTTILPAWAGDCGGPSACYLGFTPAGQTGRLHYFASQDPASSPGDPHAVLVVVHGHPRDALTSFAAAWQAVQQAGTGARTLVVAPLFQVASAETIHCRSPGVPSAEAGDLLWTCASWIAGEPARGSPLTSFAAMDALVRELLQRWPGLRTVTVAGFSAGAQMVQHYIGFAALPPAGVALRYVVAAPGSWLYFDPVWPADTLAACPAVQRWKYGTGQLPAGLGRSAAEARARYAQADIHYLVGALDSSDAAGTFYKILDKSCAAQAQGPYRLQRAQAYADYERRLLAPVPQRSLVIVPGCAHDVACVFPSAAARAALVGG